MLVHIVTQNADFHSCVAVRDVNSANSYKYSNFFSFSQYAVLSQESNLSQLYTIRIEETRQCQAYKHSRRYDRA